MFDPKLFVREIREQEDADVLMSEILRYVEQETEVDRYVEPRFQFSVLPNCMCYVMVTFG